MVVGKDKLKKNILKKIAQNQNTHCSICRQPITYNDIEDEKFEYCKSKYGENYAHSKCIKLRGGISNGRRNGKSY